MNHQSDRQKTIESIRKQVKMGGMGLSLNLCGLIACSRCGVHFGSVREAIFELDLDEIEGRHDGGTGVLPPAVDPSNHQWLCRSCHTYKTEPPKNDPEQRRDYLVISNPQLKAIFVAWAEMAATRVKLGIAGEMKPDLDDVEVALMDSLLRIKARFNSGVEEKS